MANGKMVVGTAALAAANALRLAAQVLVLPIVAGLLGPQSYGIVALATPFVFLLLMFGDVGFAAALVRAPVLTAELESTIFWIASLIGAALGIFLFAFANPLGRLLGQPEVSSILMGLAPLFGLVSLSVVPAARLQREGRFVTVARSEIVSAFAGMAAAIFGATSGWGAWSIVAQQFAIWIVKLAILLSAAGFRPQFVFRPGLVRSSVKFGSGLWAANIIGFLAGNLDNILIGSFIGPIQLGFYALSFQIVSIPNAIFGALHFSLFPAFANAYRESLPSEKTFVEAFRVILLVVTPAIIGLELTAGLLVGLLLGDAWQPAILIIRILAPIGLLMSVFILNSALFLGHGRSDLELRMQIVRCSLIVAGIAAGLAFGGPEVATGVTLAVIVSFFISMRLAMQVGSMSIAPMWEAARGPVISSLIMGAAVFVLQAGLFARLPAVANLMLTIASGCLFYVSALFFGFRASLLSDLFLVRSLVLRKTI